MCLHRDSAACPVSEPGPETPKGIAVTRCDDIGTGPETMPPRPSEGFLHGPRAPEPSYRLPRPPMNPSTDGYTPSASSAGTSLPSGLPCLDVEALKDSTVEVRKGKPGAIRRPGNGALPKLEPRAQNQKTQLHAHDGGGGGGYPSSPFGGPAAPPMMYGMQHAGPLASMIPTAGPWTAVMVRYVPNKYTRDLLLDRLNRRFKGSFDFLHLPRKTEGDDGEEGETNRGYAFINFRSHHFAAYFASIFHRVKADICLPGFPSTKVCEVSQARLHSVQKQLEAFRERQLKEPGDARWHPLFFDLQGNPLPFPTGKLSSKAPNFVPTMSLSPGEMQETAVRLQIEFYFSFDNLCKDLYLRSFMDEEGWTPLETIANFPKVKKYGATMADIVKAVKPSDLIEVDPAELRVRLKEEESRKKFSKVPEDLRTSVAAGGKELASEKA